jgi:hypothetical protein
MPKFEVRWTCDIEAETPLEAAEKAWKDMRKAGSTLDHFRVQDPTGTIDMVCLGGVGSPSRPEDLADLAPEMVAALRDVSREMGFDDGPYYDTTVDLLDRAERAK